MGPPLGANRPRHRHRTHGGHLRRPGGGGCPRQKARRRSAGLSARVARAGLSPGRSRFHLARVPELADAAAALGQLLAWPTIASKNWVYHQYDHMVRDGSVVCPGSDAAVVRHQGRFAPRRAHFGQPRPGKIHRHDGGLQRVLRLSGSVRRRQNRRGPKRPAIWPVPAPRPWARRTISISPARGTRNCSGNSRNPCAAWPRPAASSRRRSPAATAAYTIKAQRPH